MISLICLLETSRTKTDGRDLLIAFGGDAMPHKIYRTKKYVIMGTSACLLWMYSVMILLDHQSLAELPIIIKMEGLLNISLLMAGVIFLWCLILLFKKRPLLQAGENGLHLQVSKKNYGIIPWRHIAHFDCSLDQREVRVYLQGLWDIPDDCGEKFDIQVDENRQRMIVLPLRHKVRDPVHVCNELEEWRRCYSDGEVARNPQIDERFCRRIASAKKHGAGSMLIPLYFIHSKFWILAMIGFLFLAALVEKWTAFSRPVVLAITAVPTLLLSFIIRRLLLRAISALEHLKEKNQDRMIGL